MNIEIPFGDKLTDELEDRIFKRKLVLWEYYIKERAEEAVATETGIPLSTVSAIISKWREHGVIEDLPRSGRAKETTEEEENKVIEKQKTDRKKPATVIHREMMADGSDISYHQTLSVINDNFDIVYAPYKIEIRPCNKVKRVEWIEKHQQGRDWKWNLIVWTDEKMFRLCPQTKRVKIKIMEDESIEDFALPKKQQGESGVMFWGGGVEYRKSSL